MSELNNKKILPAEKKSPQVPEPKEPVRMPMLVLRGLVLFPQMVLHFDVGREKSILALNRVMSGDRKIFLVAQKNIRDDEPKADGLYKIGVVAQVKQIIKSQGGTWRVLVEGMYRAKTIEVLSESPFFEGMIAEFPLRITRSVKSAMCDALMRTVKDLFEEYCYLTPRMPKELIVSALVSEDPVHLAEYIAGNMQMGSRTSRRSSPRATRSNGWRSWRACSRRKTTSSRSRRTSRRRSRARSTRISANTTCASR